MSWLILAATWLLYRSASSDGEKGDGEKGNGGPGSVREGELLVPREWSQSAVDAARQLSRFYASASLAVRAGKQRSPVVERLQAAMGIEADGLIGDQTRNRARELGHPLLTPDGAYVNPEVL